MKQHELNKNQRNQRKLGNQRKRMLKTRCTSGIYPGIIFCMLIIAGLIFFYSHTSVKASETGIAAETGSLRKSEISKTAKKVSLETSEISGISEVSEAVEASESSETEYNEETEENGETEENRETEGTEETNEYEDLRKPGISLCIRNKTQDGFISGLDTWPEGIWTKEAVLTLSHGETEEIPVGFEYTCEAWGTSPELWHHTASDCVIFKENTEGLFYFRSVYGNGGRSSAAEMYIYVAASAPKRPDVQQLGIPGRWGWYGADTMEWVICPGSTGEETGEAHRVPTDIYYQVDSRDAVCCYCSETMMRAENPVIPEGIHSISFWSQDAAGNCSEVLSMPEIKLDTRAPAAKVHALDVNAQGYLLSDYIDISVKEYCKDADEAQDDTFSGLSSVSCTVYGENGHKQWQQLYTLETTEDREGGERREETVYSKQWHGRLQLDRKAFQGETVCIEVTARDQAGNESSCTSEQWKIDISAPVIEVEFDNNQAENTYYFNRPRTAVIRIWEQHFVSEHTVIYIWKDGQRTQFQNCMWTGTASGNGSQDFYQTTIPFEADGEYRIEISAADEAENLSGHIIPAAGTCAAETFVIDTLVLSPRIEGVSQGMSYKTDMAVSIAFRDKNYQAAGVKLYQTGEDGMIHDRTQMYFPNITRDSDGRGMSAVSSAVWEDGCYQLLVYGKDMGGNEAQSSMQFNVNHLGPRFVFAMDILQCNQQYLRQVDRAMHIFLQNPDSMEADIKDVQILRDGRLQTDTLGTFQQTSVSEDGWYRGLYEIAAENFITDGLYQIYLTAEDSAGNQTNTVLQIQNHISFAVDTTAPQIGWYMDSDAGILQTDIFDSIALKGIRIYIDEKLILQEDISGQKYSTPVSIKSEADRNENRQWMVIAEDMAGNYTVTDGTMILSEAEAAGADTITAGEASVWLQENGEPVQQAAVAYVQDEGQQNAVNADKTMTGMSLENIFRILDIAAVIMIAGCVGCLIRLWREK